MKKIAILIAGLGVAAATIPAASAQQGWWGINQRQAQLDKRIDRGIRRGEINRREAARLRTEFRGIAQLEYRYRRTGSGLSRWER